jgi:2-phospho-L-lactate guanylyltransferase
VNVVALVPAKSLSSAKSRLAPALDPAQRADMSLDLLRSVLVALQATASVSQVAVLSPDERALALARERGATPLEERQGSLNRALYLGRAWAIGAQADGLLVVLSDLPLARAEDLAALIQADAQVAIAPSKDGGTNALLLRPPDAIPFRFGRASARRHRLEAERRGLPIAVVHRDTLAFDVDTPDDLAALERLRIPHAV